MDVQHFLFAPFIQGRAGPYNLGTKVLPELSTQRSLQQEEPKFLMKPRSPKKKYIHITTPNIIHKNNLTHENGTWKCLTRTVNPDILPLIIDHWRFSNSLSFDLMAKHSIIRPIVKCSLVLRYDKNSDKLISTFWKLKWKTCRQFLGTQSWNKL